jgi:serine phosphatase RsbU (regulator of sigma subunit)
MKADGTLSKLDKGGLMVGIFPGLSYEEDEIVLAPGDA